VGVSDAVEVSAGEVVILAKYSGTEVKIEGKNTGSWTQTSSSA
jgi:co-chaperonin GroES (HSP10)